MKLSLCHGVQTFFCSLDVDFQTNERATCKWTGQCVETVIASAAQAKTPR